MKRKQKKNKTEVEFNVNNNHPSNIIQNVSTNNSVLNNLSSDEEMADIQASNNMNVNVCTVYFFCCLKILFNKTKDE